MFRVNRHDRQAISPARQDHVLQALFGLDLGEHFRQGAIGGKRFVIDDDRIVIISDLHMGNNTRRDDFRKNADLFELALKKYYQKLNPE